MNIQITKVVVQFDVKRREVASTATFITSFIQIIMFEVVCANKRPTQPPDFNAYSNTWADLPAKPITICDST